MNHIAIRNEVRRRVIEATGINPLTELKIEGKDFNSSGKRFWAEEYLIGGTQRAMTNQRSRVSSYLVQYDLCCPVGTETTELEQKLAAIETELFGVSFGIDNAECTVKTIKPTRHEEKLRNRIAVLLTIELIVP